MAVAKPITGKEKDRYDWLSPMQIHLRNCFGTVPGRKKGGWLLGGQLSGLVGAASQRHCRFPHSEYWQCCRVPFPPPSSTRLSSLLSLIGKKWHLVDLMCGSVISELEYLFSMIYISCEFPVYVLCPSF